MTHTIEISMPELLKRWNMGEIPPSAKVAITFDDTMIVQPAKKTPLYFGAFKGNFPDLELEDFKIAEHQDNLKDLDI
jgi:hypothetical protein